MRDFLVENGWMDYMKWVLAALAAFVHGVPELTWFLILLMGVDMALGVIAAIIQRDLSAREMAAGVGRKVGRLLFVALGAGINRYVKVPGLDFVMVFTGFYIWPEVVSIMRNAVIVGIPVPPQLVEVMRRFQSEDKANEDRVLPKDGSGATGLRRGS